MRHVEAGEKPFDAAIKGSREIGFTIVSMTLSLVAVFIPVMFMSGIIGRLLHEFAVTISAAILVSGLVSLTPMLASRYLKHEKNAKHNRAYWLFERVFDRLLVTAVEHLKALEQELRPPASLTTSLQGTAQAFEESRQGLLLLVAVLVVYLVLEFLTLFLTPVIYLYMERLADRFRGKDRTGGAELGGSV